MALISVQLWSIQEATKKDFVGALEEVAKMGYDGVEFAGFGDISAEDMAGHLSRLGLKVSGAHVGLDLLRDDLDGVIAYHKTIGNKYIVCPFAREESKEDWIALGKELAGYGEKLRANGMAVGYHNHDHEFIEYDGTYAMDLILDQSTDTIAELDTYWTEHAGVDTEAYLAKLGSRCPLVHLKDMEIREGGQKISIAYGEGILDHKKIINAALKNNPEWFVIEWEAFDSDCMEAIKISIDNLKKLL